MNHTAQVSNQADVAVSAAQRILIVEDDPDISQLLEINLRDSAYEVDVAGNGADGYELARSGRYQLLVLDRMLPGIDGHEICKRLRGQGYTLPILMLTANTAEFDRVLGLELGADDYLTKPFSMLELQARVKAILRRVELSRNSPDRSDEIIEVDALRIDVASRLASVAGQTLALTAKEFDLLLHFARQPGRVYSRGQLLDRIWGYSHSGYEHTVNTHINRLRKKIEANSGAQGYIETVWGVGYRFREQA